jgi:outer membrane immunogenic protein
MSQCMPDTPSAASHAARAAARHPLLLPGAVLLAGLFGAAGAKAEQAPREWRAGADQLSVEASIGLMNGTAREYVLYPDGSQMSRLTWDMKNVLMFNAGLTYRPVEWLGLTVKGATNLSGSSFMNDYDFNIPSCPPTPEGGTFCHSWHPDTTLRNAYLLDLFAAARFAKIGPVELSAVAGYKLDYYFWQAVGGSSNYTPDTPGASISYAQVWRAPYLGLAAEAEFGRWSLRGRLIGSVWANVTGIDNHHNRSLLFTDRLGPSQMVAAEIGLGYRLSEAVTLTADYRYQAWRIAQGPSTEDRLNGTPPIVTGGKAGGASNHSHSVSLGLRVQPLAGRHPLLPEPASAGPFSWTGFYGGAEIGALWQASRWTTVSGGFPPVAPLAETASLPYHAGAPRAGLFAGYATQFGRWVAGIEADFGLANANRNRNGVPGSAPQAWLNASADETNVQRGWDASLRARLGAVVAPNLMVYGTAGLAFQRAGLRASCNRGFACADYHYETVATNQTGWTLGAGAELALADNWFARGEYRYSAFPTLSHTFFAASPADSFTARVSQADHRVSFALGYRY